MWPVIGSLGLWPTEGGRRGISSSTNETTSRHFCLWPAWSWIAVAVSIQIFKCASGNCWSVKHGKSTMRCLQPKWRFGTLHTLPTSSWTSTQRWTGMGSGLLGLLAGREALTERTLWRINRRGSTVSTGYNTSNTSYVGYNSRCNIHCWLQVESELCGSSYGRVCFEVPGNSSVCSKGAGEVISICISVVTTHSDLKIQESPRHWWVLFHRGFCFWTG